ncbi:MAG: carboxymuconolactone decarboxylase family protein [Chloroflexi bacterium]|jgi:AhpD family alkylhydroperoxidase|nr:carboxymuconolactone decarboxylase family protein [Chloroflexota bacterium]
MKAKRTVLALLSAAAGAVAAYYLTEAYKQAKAKCPPFRKRTYSSARELVDAFRVFWEQPELLLSVRQNPAITPAFSEKLMLTVTGANGCRYCAGVHTEIAKHLGLRSDEVGALLRGEIGQGTVDEAPALFFAQQYAISGGNPDQDLLRGLTETYGDRTARDIISHVQLMTIANLVGNTFDALLSRILGKPAPDSTLGNELAVLATFAFGIMPLAPILAIRAQLACAIEA